MTDIVERLRGLRFVHVPVASQLMAEAAAEIERLRLADEERKAVEWFASLSWGDVAQDGHHAATLRSLLTRLAVK